jgi:mRNA interferase MazF
MAKGLEALGRGTICMYRFRPPDKERPVLIVTRGSALRYLTRVTVAPITSTIRGNDSELLLGVDDGLKGPSAANFDNLVTVNKAALGRIVSVLHPERMQEICTALDFAMGCMPNDQ